MELMDGFDFSSKILTWFWVIYRRAFLGCILTSILTRLGFSKILGGAQHIVRGLGSRIAEEMVKNGLGTLATLHRTPLQLSDPRSTAIQCLRGPSTASSIANRCDTLPTREMLSRWHGSLYESNTVRHPATRRLPIPFETMFIHAPYDGQQDEFVEHGNDDYCDTAINENDEDATQLEDHHVVAALLPVNFGSAEPPTDDSQDPSELGELHVETASNRDARSDLGIDVDPAQYDQSCSHASSASVRSPVLDLVPSTDNCHESTNFSDPLQTNDNPNHSDCSDQHGECARDNDAYNDTPEHHLHTDPEIYTSDHASNFEGQHSDHDPGEDQYADGGHYDAGDVYDGHGADLDPGDDYHDNYHDDYYEDDYYDDGGDFDYYDDDY
ncbi:hypothetical protein H4Q26_017338 [Puccinia striiformis f. sp. tritici PST-130]|nr:hypothetical protein H4Q26_017338 [Puccinia striiformis f. sp. tritici PST-130]